MSQKIKNTPGNDSQPLPLTPVPLLDIGRENLALEDQFKQAIAEVYRSGRFVLGPDCVRLEERMAQRCGATDGIGCASGSEALLLALMAIDVGAGDEVIVPSFTFFATASAVWRLGAKPVFVDIEPLTFNLDPSAVAAAVNRSTKAIIPVHLFGQCANMRAIREIAQRHKLTVIEDAAQAVGAKYEGRGAGSLADIGCFSFYPTKNLGAWGDGGLLTTSDSALAERLRLLRGHGMEPRYYHQVVGINSRLDSIQAAVLNVKLDHLPQWTRQRQANAQRYCELLAAAGLDRFIQVPTVLPENEHVWNQFTIRVPSQHRDAQRRHLSDAKIGTEIYYPVPIHRQACFQALGYGEGSLPETERAAKEVLSLPIFPQLTAPEQQSVVRGITQFFNRSGWAKRPTVLVPAFTGTPSVAGQPATP